MVNPTSTNVVQMPETNSPQVTGVGFTGLDNLSEDEFFEVGFRLHDMERGMQWCIGDWFNAIPWGDKKAACEKVGISYKHAAKCGSVCEVYQSLPRSKLLGFVHHQTVAVEALSDGQRLDLLKQAEKEGWSSARLKTERDSVLGLEPPVPTKSLDTTAESLVEAVKETLPKSASKKTVTAATRAVKKIYTDMKHEFVKSVQQEAKRQTEDDKKRLRELRKDAEKERERIVQMKVGVKAFMSKEEFTLVRSCLHPDKNPHPKAGEAFNIFNKLADVKSWD